MDQTVRLAEQKGYNVRMCVCVCLSLCVYTSINSYAKISLLSHAGLATCMLNNHKVVERKLFAHTDRHTYIRSHTAPTSGLFKCHVLTQISSNFLTTNLNM